MFERLMRTTNSNNASAIEHRRHDVDRDRQQRDEQTDTEIERDRTALRRSRPEQSPRQLAGPGVDMLDRDHHDRRRQHRARDIGEHGEQQRGSRQHRHGVDEDGERALPAERAVSQTRPDIDAVGDAAKGRGNRVGNAKANQQAIVARTQFTRPAGEFGAEQRIDRGDDRQR